MSDQTNEDLSVPERILRYMENVNQINNPSINAWHELARTFHDEVVRQILDEPTATRPGYSPQIQPSTTVSPLSVGQSGVAGSTGVSGYSGGQAPNNINGEWIYEGEHSGQEYPPPRNRVPGDAPLASNRKFIRINPVYSHVNDLTPEVRDLLSFKVTNKAWFVTITEQSHRNREFGFNFPDPGFGFRRNSGNTFKPNSMNHDVLAHANGVSLEKIDELVRKYPDFTNLALVSATAPGVLPTVSVYNGDHVIFVRGNDGLLDNRPIVMFDDGLFIKFIIAVNAYNHRGGNGEYSDSPYSIDIDTYRNVYELPKNLLQL